MVDPYFLPEYAAASAGLEGGVPEYFYYESAAGLASTRFIRRPIYLGATTPVGFDIITPYGYGGPRFEPRSNRSQELVEAYVNAFGQYCRKNDIVSEFIRFHPFEVASSLLQGYYSIERIRDTVVTDLRGDEAYGREFSKSARKKVRRNQRDGIVVEVRAHPDDLSDFIRLYTQTMDRNSASAFYYFGPDYFTALTRGMSRSLVLFHALKDGAVVAAALCLVGARRIHVHLSATDTSMLGLSPAYNIRHAIFEWGKEHRYEYIHHGGGRTNDTSDTLLQYKRQFGSMTLDFHTGKKVWNEEKYGTLAEASGSTGEATAGFFPAYRQR